ncbi:MAG: enoyl-ACP reductase [Phycisphaerae bacterium]|nr:enoyl-ACP reductase [Phycisphaerae bacterium]
MGLMSGKRGIVFGVANDRSYAWYISKQLIAQGAECAFTYLPLGKMERRVRKATDELGLEDPWLMSCDAGNDEELDAVFAKLKADFGRIDFIVHSIAFAEREFLQVGRFHTTSRKAFTDALDISAYTLVAMAQRAVDLMPDGGSIVSMSYYGGEKVIPGYNVMGVAKAALEHTTRYLASELGEKKIRVNAISGGPLKTLAASAVGKIDEMFAHQQAKAPLKRNIEGEEVGDTALFLLSDMASGITGEVIHVDGGFNVVGL